MIRPDQIQKIHIKRKQAGLSRDDYESMLAGYGVASCKDLSSHEADGLIDTLDSMMGEKQDWGKNKYEHLGNRPGFASPRELRKIEAIWREVAYKPSDEALAEFLNRQTRKINGIGISSIEMLGRAHVKPVLTALKMMKRERNQMKQIISEHKSRANDNE